MDCNLFSAPTFLESPSQLIRKSDRFPPKATPTCFDTPPQQDRTRLYPLESSHAFPQLPPTNFCLKLTMFTQSPASFVFFFPHSNKSLPWSFVRRSPSLGPEADLTHLKPNDVNVNSIPLLTSALVSTSHVLPFCEFWSSPISLLQFAMNLALAFPWSFPRATPRDFPAERPVHFLMLPAFAPYLDQYPPPG